MRTRLVRYRRVGLTAAVAGGALGILAESRSPWWDDPARWIPDLLVGWAFLAAGAASSRRPATATLLGATGLAWFAGAVWLDLIFLHRAVLAQLALAGDGWRPTHLLDLTVLAVAYALGLDTGASTHELVSSVVVVGVAALALARYRGVPAAERLGHRVALAAATGAVVAVAGSTVARASASSDADTSILTGYQMALGLTALGCVAQVRQRRGVSVTDLIVELTDERGHSLEASLRHALEDPTLVIGHRIDGGRYVDGHGQLVDTTGPNRVTTVLGSVADPSLVLIHDVSVAADPRLIDAVQRATHLWRAHDALTGELVDRVVEVGESRRRLVRVADDERRRLSDRLRNGPDQALRRLVVSATELAAGAPIDVAGHLARAGDQLDETRTDVGRLADGLHPSDLDGGLLPALERLVSRSPIPAVLVFPVDDEVVDRDLATAIYYVCAEGLTNATKHARCTEVWLTVGQVDDRVSVEVSDDGRGGVDLEAGTGLRGLVDRVEALGGSLRIESDAGAGTRLRAVLPLGPQGEGN